MYRYTTPRHTFSFPSDPSKYIAIRVTYKQDGKIVLQKELEDMTVGEENTVYYYLSQEETALFKNDSSTKVQAHVKLPDGHVYASEEFTVKTNRVLDDEGM